MIARSRAGTGAGTTERGWQAEVVFCAVKLSSEIPWRAAPRTRRVNARLKHDPSNSEKKKTSIAATSSQTTASPRRPPRAPGLGTRRAGRSPSARAGGVCEPGSCLSCFFDGHTPFSGFALQNKGVPIMLNYFKTTGSRLLPAGPERGRYTSKEPLPRGSGAEGPAPKAHPATSGLRPAASRHRCPS